MSNTETTNVGSVDVVESDDQLLDFTQRTRKALIEKFTRNGMPGDVKEASVILGALADIDRQVIGKKRLKIDEEAMRGGAAIAFNVAQVLRGITNKPTTDGIESNRSTPVLGSEIPDPALIPGETDIAPIQVDYDTFQAQVQESRSTI